MTAAGTLFLDDARALLARLESAKARASRAARGDVGTLSVGFVSIADFGILPPALKSFRNSHPSVEVQLHELTTDAQIRDLRALRLDLGVGLGPVHEPDITFEPLLEEELILALPASHPLARAADPVKLRDLAQESFIVVPRDLGPGLFDLTMSRCLSAGFTPRITQHARQMQTVIGLVSCGMGFALVPSSVQHLRRPGVHYRRVRGKAARLAIGALQLALSQSPLQAHFVDALHAAAGRVTP